MAARTKRTRKPKAKRKVKGKEKRPASAGTFLVKGHTRNPRGPDRGKKPVRVPPHRRRNP